MKFTDSHCHLDFDEFTSNLNRLIDECNNKNIHQIIIPAITPDNWQKVVDLPTIYSESPCKLFSCLGIHPWFLKPLTQQHLTQLSQFIKQYKQHIVAIGETGIDGVIAKEENNLAQQIHFFDHHLALAKEYHLPIIVHHRRSHTEVLERIKAAKLNHGGIIHAFSGSYQQACQYIDLGFKLGIGGTITYSRAEKTIKAIKRVPLNSLVLETDAPSMPLSGFQGTANSPIRLLDVFFHLVEIRSETAEEISSTIEQTIKQLFRLS